MLGLWDVAEGKSDVRRNRGKRAMQNNGRSCVLCAIAIIKLISSLCCSFAQHNIKIADNKTLCAFGQAFCGVCQADGLPYGFIHGNLIITWMKQVVMDNSDIRDIQPENFYFHLFEFHYSIVEITNF